MKKSDYVSAFRVYSSTVLQGIWDKTQNEIVEQFEKENKVDSDEMDMFISLGTKLKSNGALRYTSIPRKCEMIGLQSYFHNNSFYLKEHTVKWTDSQREEYEKVLVAFETVKRQLGRCKSDKQCRALLIDYGLEHILPSSPIKQIASTPIVDAETVEIISKIEKIIPNNTVLISNE